MLPFSGFSEKKKAVIEFFTNEFMITDETEQELCKFLDSNFFSQYLRYWKCCHRCEKRFLTKHDNWLQETLPLPPFLQGRGLCSAGRPSKNFAECSESSKRKKTSDLRRSFSSLELSYAAAMNLREEGDTASATLITECVSTTPTRSTRILSKWRSQETNSSPLTPEEALSMLISLNMSKYDYNVLRRSAVSHGHDLYPSYHKLSCLKNELYPKNILISEKVCEVPLQDLLDNTSESICKLLTPDQINSLSLSCGDNNLSLICKWGFDGSSGFTPYKQTFLTEGSQDESVFITSLVPLRLMEINSQTTIWKNQRPSSGRFCRPVRLQWVHESNAISTHEEIYITNQITKLVPYASPIGSIQFSLHLTMVDGKVCNALSGASSMRCYICDATISQLNDLKLQSTKINKPENYRFGLSVLHAYIRFFECLLHISYRLDLKSWKVSPAKRDEFNTRKKYVQDTLKTKMGLIVDVPKQGFGSSNDGNTARRFFKDPQLSAELTGLDKELIERFGVILSVINSGLEIEDVRFDQYCRATAERYILLYPWYYMPVSVHKVLIHGSDIVKNFILPIGELSEEAQEAKNKTVRYYKEHHTRKLNRLKGNEDLMKRLLLSSDPHLSSLSYTSSKRRTPITPVMRDLLSAATSSSEEESGDES